MHSSTTINKLCMEVLLFTEMNKMHSTTTRLSSIPIFPIFSAIPINSYFLRNSYFFLFLWVFRFAVHFFAANPQISLRRTCISQISEI